MHLYNAFNLKAPTLIGVLADIQHCVGAASDEEGPTQVLTSPHNRSCLKQAGSTVKDTHHLGPCSQFAPTIGKMVQEPENHEHKIQ